MATAIEIEKKMKVLKKRLQRQINKEKLETRKARSHYVYCVGGAVIKYRPDVLDDILASISVEDKPPAGHVQAIKYVAENREAIAAELRGAKQ